MEGVLTEDGAETGDGRVHAFEADGAAARNSAGHPHRQSGELEAHVGSSMVVGGEGSAGVSSKGVIKGGVAVEVTSTERMRTM